MKMKRKIITKIKLKLKKLKSEMVDFSGFHRLMYLFLSSLFLPNLLQIPKIPHTKYLRYLKNPRYLKYKNEVFTSNTIDISNIKDAS